MQIIHHIAQLRQLIAEHKSAGKSIGFVPTMGNLHQGHLQLVELASAQADIIVCSIFVNPLQFGEGEDFAEYPRTLDADAAQLRQIDCDILFAPAVSDIYPESSNGGRDQMQVIVPPELADILEGAARPGHFTGVATIVTKLFNMVQPDKAIFGAKDYQQLQVIYKLVKDLCLPIEIIAHPIVRESTGLAMSSRNAYLSDSQKQQAIALFKTLKSLATQLKNNTTKLKVCDYSQLEQDAIKQLDAQGFKTDYLCIRARNLALPTDDDKELVILVTAYLGTTRLLDNLQVSRVCKQ
ncbi:pantoate--beta-alanine ligase [sulfur-oxidizing endosymbiont of Gigantopelta aegis]|uniref:pantoate--beta-alanine ligase n=1 Tax=sulfur-oxidizing endosymbiont of Gigantopelta aegis TaxID=2794934 RepID=UPI0018DD16D4|nr:pantoate--beta-alanine ligase [sulfur-oxidizing endosymbiont of Gigantopelta aegis]